jgi:hypothetical protein
MPEVFSVYGLPQQEHSTANQARTPYQRVLEQGVLTLEQQETLARQYQKLNPVKLLEQVDQALQKLWSLADSPVSNQWSVTLSSEATNGLR